MENPQQIPIIRDFSELPYIERTLALAHIGVAMDICFLIDEFLQHDPHTQMFIAWLEDTVEKDIQLGSCITLEIGQIGKD